jgi:hypothetical protein
LGNQEWKQELGQKQAQEQKQELGQKRREQKRLARSNLQRQP